MKLINNIKRIIHEEKDWFLNTEVSNDNDDKKLFIDETARKEIDERVKEILDDIETRILKLF
jgi:hypothetical protein